METATEEALQSLEVFERCSYKINQMLHTLMRQLDFFVNPDEILSEAQERWVSCYEYTYETDDQFLRYMFVVMKNKIRDLKKAHYRYQRMHVSDPAKLTGIAGDSEGEMGHTRVWNEMAVDMREEMPITNCEIREAISMIDEALAKPFHRKVFALMVQGLPHQAIAEELGCSTGHVVKTKKDAIWPIVKKVMKIPDDKYDVLIDSGRIYCP